LAFSQFTIQSFGGGIIAHLVDGDCIEFVANLPKIK
jgi:hypothetical protein